MKSISSNPIIKNVFFYLLIFFNVILLIFVFNRIDSKGVEQVGFDNACETIISAMNYQFQSEGRVIDLGDQNDTLQILCLRYNKVFVLRIGEKQCDICVSEAIIDFKDFLSTNESFKGLILASFDNERDFESFRNGFIGHTVLNIGMLNLNVETINNPYLFLLDHRTITDMVFIHQKEFPEKTKNYFKAVEARFTKL